MGVPWCLTVAPPCGDGVDRLCIIIRDTGNQVMYNNRLGTAEDMDQAEPQSPPWARRSGRTPGDPSACPWIGCPQMGA